MDHYCGGGTQWRFITIALRHAHAGESSSETTSQELRYNDVGSDNAYLAAHNASMVGGQSPGAVIDACAGLTLIQASAIVHFLFILQMLIAWTIWPKCKRMCSLLRACDYRVRNRSSERDSLGSVSDRDDEYALLRSELRPSLNSHGSIQLHERGTVDFEEDRDDDGIPRHMSYEFPEPNHNSSAQARRSRGPLSSIGESTHEEDYGDEYSQTDDTDETDMNEESRTPTSEASIFGNKHNQQPDSANTFAANRASFVSFLVMSLGYGLWTVIGVLGMTTASDSSLQGDDNNVHTTAVERVPFLLAYYAISFGGGLLGICGIIICAREGTTQPVQGFLFKFSFILPSLFFTMYLHRLAKLSAGHKLVSGGVLIGKKDTEHAWALSTGYCCISITLLSAEATKFFKKYRQSISYWTHTYSEWITFSWLNPLIDKGEQRQLQEDDLDPLSEAEATVPCSNKFEDEIFRIRNSSRKDASITSVIWNLYAWPWLLLGFLQLLNAASSFAGPLLIKELLQFLQSYPGTPQKPTEKEMEKSAFASASSSPWIAVMVGAAMCLNAVVSAVSQTQFGFYAAKLQARVRAGLLNAIFRVGLTMSRFDWHFLSLSESSKDGGEESEKNDTNSAQHGSVAGTLVNLLSVDTQKVLTALSSVHQLWSLPVQVCVTLYLLWLQVSWAFFAGLGVLFFFLPINLFVSKRIGDLTKEMMEFRDERLRVCEDALKNISLIKMQRLELQFSRRIKAIRSKEVDKLKARKYWDALCVYLWAATPVLVSLATFASAALSGRMQTYEESSADNNNLTTAEVFTTLSLLQMLIVPMNAFPWVITGIMEARVSVNRFNRILFHSKILDRLLSDSKRTVQQNLTIPAASIVWPSQAAATRAEVEEPVAKFVLSIPQPIHVEAGELVVIAGRVGSGKTALLRSLFADMLHANTHESTFVSFASYAPQRPWIRESSVYRNITCCGPHLQHETNYFRDERYKFVKYCAGLEEDINEMPLMDRSEVGEKGGTLSGGQQQRIGIARALYSSSPLLIMDDPLSALDAFVKAQVRDYAILGLSGSDPADLSVDKKASLVKSRTRFVATHEESVIQRCDKIIGLEQGTVIFTGTRKDFFDKIESSDLASRLGIKTAKLFAPTSSGLGGEYSASTKNASVKQTSSESLEHKEEAEEYREAGYISLHVLHVYIVAMGRIVVASLLLFLLLMQVTRNGSDYWLSQWSDALSSKNDMHNGGSSSNKGRPWVENQWSSNHFLHIYIAIAVLNTLFTIGRSWLFAYGGVQGARKMHTQLLESVFVAKMRFFQKNPVGRILNRFSSDQLNVDETLPFQANILLAQLFGLVGTCAVILYASTGWLFLAVLPIAFLYWRTQKRYRFTSRELRRLESILRSPLYSHFGDCLSEEGSSVIRAGGPYQVNRETDTLLNLIDRSQRAWFSTKVAVQWLSFRLQCIGVLAISFVAGFAVFRRLYQVDNSGKEDSSATNTEAGAAGLALSYALPIVDSLQGILNSFAETEKEMVSVERQSEYIEDAEPEQDPAELFEHQVRRCCECHIAVSRATKDGRKSRDKSENSLASPLLGEESLTSPPPKHLLLSVRELYVQYADIQESKERSTKIPPWVLKGISFDVARGEHIGICGRTGSGKSTIFSTLFRLVEHSHGHIFIEGEDTRNLSLSSLRSKISIIPQEPLLFEGTVRDNLDPVHELPTQELEAALYKCNILKNPNNKQQVGRFALDDYIASSGSNLSMGLRQLMCLARCILQEQSLVCIDEATASVDSDTATNMNDIIRTVFKESGATVIVIAHRHESLFQCDRLLVMEDGNIIEEDTPEALSKNTASAFYRMYGGEHQSSGV